MSFLKNLFSHSNDSDNGTGDKIIDQDDYEEFKILAITMKDGAQYRVCALIQKEVDGEMLEHRLIRADTCSSPEEAAQIAIRKGRQMIDEQHVRLFKTT